MNNLNEDYEYNIIIKNKTLDEIIDIFNNKYKFQIDKSDNESKENLENIINYIISSEDSLSLSNWIEEPYVFAGAMAKGKFSVRYNLTDCMILVIQILWNISRLGDSNEWGSVFEPLLSYNNIKNFFEKITIMKDNYERCIYLKLFYLSKNDCDKIIKLEDVKNFNLDSNKCCFHDIFQCNSINREDSSLCGVPHINIKNVLHSFAKKGIIIETDEGYYMV